MERTPITASRAVEKSIIYQGLSAFAIQCRKRISNPDACNNFKPLYESQDVVRQAYCDAGKSRDVSVYGAHVKLHRLVAKLLPAGAMMRIWKKIK